MNESQRKRGKAIHRKTGQTFYYATRLLPKRIRDQTYVLYGFFRIADEVVDGGEGLDDETKRAELESLRAAALGETDAEDPVVEAFAELRERSEISKKEVDEFIDAMLADINTDRYETFDDLQKYTRGSAAAVGNMMLAIMDADSPEAARPHAMALGEAFQLTNFIRDVDEDITELDRIYLPMETLERYDVTPSHLRQGKCTPGFRQAVQFELRRTEQLYRKGVRGIEYLPDDCRFPVLLAAVLYAEHHRIVRAQAFDVLTARPSLSHRRKLWLLVQTWWHWRRFRNAATVFERVSAIPTEDQDTHEPFDDTELTAPSTD